MFGFKLLFFFSFQAPLLITPMEVRLTLEKVRLTPRQGTQGKTWYIVKVFLNFNILGLFIPLKPMLLIPKIQMPRDESLKPLPPHLEPLQLSELCLINLFQQCFILKVFDCFWSMFGFSIRQDLDRIQRIFASCEAVGCLDTGVGGGGRCIYNYIIAGLAWSLKNTPGDLCNCKKWGHLYMDYLVGVMSDTSSFFKGVSEFRGILTLWPQVFNIFNVAHVRSLPTSKIAFRKIGYLLKSLGHSAKQARESQILDGSYSLLEICRLKTCDFLPKKHLSMEVHPSVADDRNPSLIKPPGRTSTENSTRNAFGEVAWVEWWFC